MANLFRLGFQSLTKNIPSLISHRGISVSSVSRLKESKSQLYIIFLLGTNFIPQVSRLLLLNYVFHLHFECTCFEDLILFPYIWIKYRFV